jgi:WD40 repeat protein
MKLIAGSFCPNGKRLASADNEGRIIIWDCRTGLETLSLIGHPSRVNSIEFSPDGKWLAGVGDGVVKIWDARPLKPEEAFINVAHARP